MGGYDSTDTIGELVKPNCDRKLGDTIQCKRDLEDFTRLHLKVDAKTAGLPDVTYWMKFENVTLDSPSVNIFEAVDESSDYLKLNDAAEKQLKKKMLLTVGSNEVQLPSQSVKTGGVVSPFILEGRHAGVGDLTLIVKWDGVEIGRSAIRLDLKEPSEFVETYVVKTTNPSDPTVDTIESEATPTGNPTYLPENKEYVLFVHGWNMPPWLKDRWLETTFKRLWWQGYKGRVGGFQWPTLWGGTITGLHYDHSEFRAWRSAEALSKLLTTLDGKYPGQVRVIAHSMGNVVTGEALRKPSTPKIHAYIAAQAAIPAHMYDPSDALTEKEWKIKTPDVYRHFYSGKAPDSPYLSGVKDKATKMFRYFNKDDFALKYWDIGNKTKPDDQTNNYFYDEGDGDIDSYAPNYDHPGQGDLFHTLVSNLWIPRDTFEVFAYCVQSRSRALGAVNKPVTGFTDLDLSQPPFNFDEKHYSHNREFQSNIVREWPFWSTLAQDFELTVLER